MSTSRYIYVDLFNKHVSRHASQVKLDVPKFAIMLQEKVTQKGVTYTVVYLNSQLKGQLHTPTNKIIPHTINIVNWETKT